jgi:hypothetical protein
MRAAKLLIAAIACASAAGRAESDLVWTTNWVKSEAAFRTVDGRLYNVDKSEKFESFRGDVVEVLTNGLVISQEVKKSRPIRPSTDPLIANGNLLGRAGGLEVRYETYWESTGKFVFIKNYQGQPATGQIVHVDAMQIQNTKWNGSVIEAYDYGLPNYCMVISTNGRRAMVISTNISAAAQKESDNTVGSSEKISQKPK